MFGKISVGRVAAKGIQKWITDTHEQNGWNSHYFTSSSWQCTSLMDTSRALHRRNSKCITVSFFPVDLIHPECTVINIQFKLNQIWIYQKRQLKIFHNDLMPQWHPFLFCQNRSILVGNWILTPCQLHKITSRWLKCG